MIENRSQYFITKREAGKISNALRALAGLKHCSPRVHPDLALAEIEALKAVLEELYAEIAEYEKAYK